MLVAADLIKRQFDTGVWKAFRQDKPVASSDLKINPHSIDVTLGDIVTVLQPRGNAFLDPRDPDSFTAVQFNVDGLVVHPGSFMLGSVRERFDTRNSFMFTGYPVYVTQLYDGRSTVGRLGIQSHMTAGYGDYGFHGYFTLEIAVQMSVKLYAGMRIGQVSFVPLLTSLTPPAAYDGVYTQGQQGPSVPVLGSNRF